MPNGLRRTSAATWMTCWRHNMRIFCHLIRRAFTPTANPGQPLSWFFYARRKCDVITFKSPGDLAQLDPQDPAYPVLKDLIEVLIEDFPVQAYNADDYGYLVLVEPQDTSRKLTE